MPREIITMKPIGYVCRALRDEDVRDKQAVSEIVLHSNIAEALEGIEDFSHLFVIFYMNRVEGAEKGLEVHPRGRADLPLLGLFATRTAFRPNPVGLTLVELLEHKGNVLVVKGLDAYDETPVLDLKPADSWDIPKHVKVPKWLDLLEKEEQDDSSKN